MSRQEWTRLAEHLAVAGALRLLDPPPGSLFVEEGVDAVVQVKPADLLDGSRRIVLLAIQSLLPGPASIERVVCSMGDDALLFRFVRGGAAGRLAELRDEWTVPSFGGLLWACAEIAAQAQIRRLDALARRLRTGAELRPALAEIGAMVAGGGR